MESSEVAAARSLLVADRWISKYAQPWVAGLVDLKRDLEHGTAKPQGTRKPKRVS